MVSDDVIAASEVNSSDFALVNGSFEAFARDSMVVSKADLTSFLASGFVVSNFPFALAVNEVPVIITSGQETIVGSKRDIKRANIDPSVFKVQIDDSATSIHCSAEDFILLALQDKGENVIDTSAGFLLGEKRLATSYESFKGEITPNLERAFSYADTTFLIIGISAISLGALALVLSLLVALFLHKQNSRRQSRLDRNLRNLGMKKRRRTILIIGMDLIGIIPGLALGFGLSFLTIDIKNRLSYDLGYSTFIAHEPFYNAIYDLFEFNTLGWILMASLTVIIMMIGVFSSLRQLKEKAHLK